MTRHDDHRAPRRDARRPARPEGSSREPLAQEADAPAEARRQPPRALRPGDADGRRASPLTGFVGERRLPLGPGDDAPVETGSRGRSRSRSRSTDEDVKRIGGAEAGRAARRRRVAGPLAVVEVAEVFKRDRQKEALGVFRTEDLEHPGVKALHEAGDFCLAGPVRALAPARARRLPRPTGSRPRRRGPRSPSAAGAPSSGSRPATRSTARTSTSRSARSRSWTGSLVHPLMGATKGDDVPADVRMRLLRGAVRGLLPEGPRDGVSVFPAAMRYAGPKEAIWHAICRKNYGCTHFIVGRDHAGVGTYYGTYDAQKIFEEFEPGELGITPLMFEHSFWCNACEGMASPEDVPARRGDARVAVGHEGPRDAPRRRAPAASSSRRPEVADILIAAMQGTVGAHGTRPSASGLLESALRAASSTPVAETAPSRR